MMKTTHAILREFNAAFATGDNDFILDQMHPDIEWNMVGMSHFKGKKEVQKELSEMNKVRVMDMEVFHTLVENNLAVVDGLLKIREESGQEKTYGFCDLYVFEGVLIRKMTSYVKLIVEN